MRLRGPRGEQAVQGEQILRLSVRKAYPSLTLAQKRYEGLNKILQASARILSC